MSAEPAVPAAETAAEPEAEPMALRAAFPVRGARPLVSAEAWAWLAE